MKKGKSLPSFTYSKKERLNCGILLVCLPEEFFAILNEMMYLVFTNRRVLRQR